MVRSARGGGAAADIERGYGGGRRGSVAASRSGGLRQYSFYLLLLGALVLMLIASRTLRSVFRREGVDAPPEGAEYETPSVTTPSVEEQQQGICARRLAEAGLDAGNSLTLDRLAVYSKMDGDVGHKGLKLGGIVTQGLAQSDLFKLTVKVGGGAGVSVSPVLRALDVPVRAVVLPLMDKVASARIKAAVDRTLLATTATTTSSSSGGGGGGNGRDGEAGGGGGVPLLPQGSVWLQDDSLFHVALFHASSHMNPVRATSEEVEVEAAAVRAVAAATCPMRVVLERVIVTTSGVVVATWQVLPRGGEPKTLRSDLAQALPRAPPKEGQTVKEPAMLHTTLARLLLPPEELHVRVEEEVVAEAVRRLSEELCGLEAEFRDLWFIEEQDLLALALRGRFVKHEAKMTCPGHDRR